MNTTTKEDFRTQIEEGVAQRRRIEAECVAELKRWLYKGADEEIAHSECDEILLNYLKQTAPEIAKAYEEAREIVGFWYS